MTDRRALAALVPTLDRELALWQARYELVAGLDEAGRGAWAGPLVAAAVVLPSDPQRCAALGAVVRDSKLLTPGQRETAYREIVATARAVGVGIVGPALIDTVKLGQANRLALRLAAENLGVQPDYCLVDYFKIPGLVVPHEGIVDGDALCLSIAAASIVAKVTRDHLMRALDSRWPGFGFASHKGYGTAQHRTALAQLGRCADHRRSFAPIAALSS